LILGIALERVIQAVFSELKTREQPDCSFYSGPWKVYCSERNSNSFSGNRQSACSSGKKYVRELKIGEKLKLIFRFAFRGKQGR
jgi:hypothetical protein